MIARTLDRAAIRMAHYEHQFRANHRADVGFASEMEADISSAHVATTAVAQIGNLLFRRLAVGSS